MSPIDLDQVEAVINRPHVIDLRDDGFTIMHPPACHPNLFACPLNLITRNNLEDTGLRGQYECELDFDGEFAIGEPIEDAAGMDWVALVAELFAARVARGELDVLHADLDAYDGLAAAAHRLGRILEVWDQTAGEVRG